MKNLNRFNRIRYRFLSCYVYSRKMKAFGSGSIIFNPMRIDQPHSITIGPNVFIAEGSWLLGSNDSSGYLLIGAGTVVGHRVHLVAMKAVSIEASVLIADNVFITDCKHDFVDISKSIIDQPVSFIGEVSIGEGSMIGENACIMGVKVGKHCVVGANAVVTKDVPDYSVVAGVPARVISHFDFELNQWVKD